MDCARQAGTLVSFDLDYRSALWSTDDAADVFRRLIGQADIVFAGDGEAAMVVGPAEDPLELTCRVSALGPSQAVIKLGAVGCADFVDGEPYRRAAVPVQALDTVGAGDAFGAGYRAELPNGEAARQRLLTAVQTGAFACLVPGDWEGMPRRAELGLLGAAEPVSR
jgi:2-dehydro-3-deoxygluconokinase